MTHNKPELLVFKIGGKVVDNPQSLEIFLQGFAALKAPKILVHGGGVIAEQLAERLAIPTSMHKGRRITSAAMRDVATMVYGGQINKTLVAKLQSLSCDAIGLTGADAGVVRSQRRDPHPIDFGFVGDVTEVRGDRLQQFIQLGLTPVIAPLTLGGELLNTNADGIASHVAEALTEWFDVSMMYCFEQAGVMLSLKDPDSLIEDLNVSDYQKMLGEDIFTEGMLPKLEECFRALQGGVKKIILAPPTQCLRSAQNLTFIGTTLHL